MFSLLMTGIRRRKKEIIPIVLVTLIITFFMSGILMVQNILNMYIKEQNRENYGDWIISSEDGSLNHPYLSNKGFLKCGTYICDEQGNSLGLKAGFLDSSLLSFARIRLYEGRLPENDTEAAADLNTLQELGYSYDLGQQITVHYSVVDEEAEEPEIFTKTYTLVGTVKPFNTLWLGAGRYPRLMLSEAEFNRYPEENVKTYWFYQFDPALTKVDEEEFFNKFREDRKDLLFNNYVYSASLWSNPEFYRIISYLMIIVAVFAVTWLLFSYVDRRVKEYYRLRTMGASRFKLNQLIFAECSAACVPAAVLGLALAYGISAAVCFAVAKKVRLEGFFAFDPHIFKIQLAAVFGSILASILLVFLKVRDSRLSAGTRLMREKDVKILRKRYKTSKTPENELLLRRTAIRRTPRVLFFVFTLMVMAFLVLCFLHIKLALYNYRELQNMQDFEMTAHDKWKMQFNNDTLEGDWYNPFYGLSTEEVQSLSETYGVSSIDKKRLNEALYLHWDGMENSEYAKEDPDVMYRGKYDSYGISLSADSYPDEKIVKKIAARLGTPLTKKQCQDFVDGKLVILLRPGGTEEKDPENLYNRIWVDFIDPTLKSGDTIEVSWWKDSEKVLHLPVVVADQKEKYQTMDLIYINKWLSLWSSRSFHLLVSDKVNEELRKLKGEGEYKWNKLEIRADQYASYEATDKILASFAEKRHYQYENYMEIKRVRLRSWIIEPLLIYGSFFIMTMLVYLIIQHNYIRLFSREMKDETQLIKQIGMTDRAMTRMIVRHKIHEYLPIFAGLIPGLLMYYLQTYFSYRKTLRPGQHEVLLRFLNKSTANPWLAALDVVIYCGIPWLILMLLIIYILMVVTAWLTNRKSVREEQTLTERRGD